MDNLLFQNSGWEARIFGKEWHMENFVEQIEKRQENSDIWGPRRTIRRT